MGVTQATIALAGGEITPFVGLLTAAVALGIVVWLWRNYRRLTQVRYGVAVAHAIAFVTVTTSFNAHAVLRTLILGSGPEGFETVSRDLLTTPWFGATLIMTAAWGLGLLIHLLGTVLGRGWED
ncbi:hypothetical protein [Gulosibacter molinativorax]|uniref:Uncharacterized protein n=1 Tax=Gulosibacter molinativorax TaxID=256821 RepID=A0ABT7C937_9MICO|nr:hypothetical protein [Gulosibacter molinativorax]MDJ1371247.1 hypothetical protein [Gulosibacter molinativorax]